MGSLPVFVDFESSWKRKGEDTRIRQVKLEEKQFNTFKLLYKDGSNN